MNIQANKKDKFIHILNQIQTSKQKQWGKSVVKELVNFIKLQYPTIKGFTDKDLMIKKSLHCGDFYHGVITNE